MAKKPPTIKTTPPDIRQVELTVPVQEVHPTTNCQRHVDMRLSHEQAITFRGLFDGLHEEGAKIKGVIPGTTKYVNTQGDAIKWILEQLA